MKIFSVAKIDGRDVAIGLVGRNMDRACGTDTRPNVNTRFEGQSIRNFITFWTGA